MDKQVIIKTKLNINNIQAASKHIIHEGFILEYLKWKGENIKYCSICGKPIEITSNKIKYCKECEEEIRQEKRINYNKQYYDKIKNK